MNIKPKVGYICKLCNKDCYKIPSSTKLFCSLACYRQYIRIYPTKGFLGKKHSNEAKEKIGKAFKGIKIKEETKLKIKLNNAKYWLGKKRSEETNIKISKNLTGRYRQEESPRWKGTDVCYKNLHVRVYKKRGMANHCEQCGMNDKSRKYYWANLTGNYKDINDYKQMCASCHKKYDLGRAKLKLLSTVVRKEDSPLTVKQ